MRLYCPVCKQWIDAVETEQVRPDFSVPGVLQRIRHVHYQCGTCFTSLASKESHLSPYQLIGKKE